MKRQALAVLAAAGLSLCGTLVAQDHAAAPMKAEPNKPLTEDELRQQRANDSRRTASEAEIIQNFKQAVGETPPRIAVFWNRGFDDQVSDWMSSRRYVVTGNSELRGEVPEGSVALQGRHNNAAQAEYRQSQPSSPANTPAFALQSGLVNQLTRAGVRVVDRAAIMRITDNALEDGSFSRLSPDQARLEMRALTEHADLLLVLEQVTEEQFHIRVLNVRDGSVRAMVSSSGTPPADQSERPWVATDRGFEKASRPPVSLDQVGRELALETLTGITSL